MAILPPTSYAGFFWHCGSFLVIDGLGECTCSYNTLSLVSCGVFSFLLFINMYVVTDDTIAVTVTDTNRVTTHAITIVIVDSLDEQLMPK